MPLTNVGYRPIRVINAGDSAGVLVNRDTVNTLIIGPSEEITSANQNKYSLVDPLVGIPFNGESDVWAATLTPGTVIVIDVIENAQNWAPGPVQIASSLIAAGLMKDTTGTAINNVLGAGIALPVGAATSAGVSTLNTTVTGVAKDATVSTLNTTVTGVAKDATVSTVNTSVGAVNTSVGTVNTTVGAQTAAGKTIAQDVAINGVPLLSSTSVVLNKVSQALAASATATWSGISITQIGYEISVGLTGNAAATVPFVSIQLTWTDSVTGLIVSQEKWFLAQSSQAGGQIYCGTGPSKGDTLQVQLVNGDSVNAVTYTVIVAQVSRIYISDDWRNQTMNSVPAFSAGTYAHTSGVLLTSAPVIGATSSQIRFVALYDGMASISATMTQTGNIQVNADGFSALGLNDTVMYQTSLAAGGTIKCDLFAMPRAFCTCKMQNTAAVANTTFVMINIARQCQQG